MPKEALSEREQSRANRMVRNLLATWDGRHKMAATTDKTKRTRGTKAEVQARWEEMASLIESGMGTGEAAEKTAEAHGVSASTMKVGWSKWAKENRPELVKARGASTETHRVIRTTPSRTANAGADVVTILNSRRDALAQQIEDAEKIIAEANAELAKIELAIAALSGDSKEDTKKGEDSKTDSEE